MSNSVKLIECPRDAWQGLKGQIPTELKVNYLQALVSAGFKQIDAVSFVSANAVPQMADSEDVLKELDPPDDVEIIGIVVNEKGAQRAVKTDAVRTLGFPYSISPTFLQNNQRQTLEDAIEELEKIEKIADEGGLDTVVYISMAFGNPYGDPWNVEEVVDAVDLLEVQNIKTISLADTVGLGADELRDAWKWAQLDVGDAHAWCRPMKRPRKIHRCMMRVPRWWSWAGLGAAFNGV